MNNKGQTTLIAIIIFVVGMLVMNFLKGEVTTAQSADNLDCNGNISDGTKLTCLVTDIVIPYAFLLVFSAAGGLIASRLI